ncbi:XRE family transcriptional regulator [Actinosynnema sp. NPDC020468]|uniref:XRE family transcriptional regulator n=1 Tax=Actinosynnema sp. NPDC020468 TaxID=3154488 RepID=UPI0033DF6D3A
MPTSDEWLRVRAHLGEHRHALAVRATAEYPDTPTVADSPLLTDPRWIPAAPMPLDLVRLHRAEGGRPGVDGTEDLVDAILPPSTGGRLRSYSAAMAALAAPRVFQDRSTYRLLEADLTGPPGRLVFGAGTYFDGIDVGEACAHEYAARDLGLLDDLPLRTAVGAPCDPARRPTNVAISTLTLRVDPDGAATFFLHWRDPKRVGHAGGLYQVLPVGVFQASGEEAWHLDNDFSLWRCVVREFAEELRGESEDYGGDRGPIDYEAWPLAARLTDALGDRVRAWYLGMGVDPLTLATDLLTVVAIDAELFDEVFGAVVRTNDEGRVLDAQPFDADTVRRFVHDEPTQAAGAALLALAWEHRGTVVR